MTGMDEDYTKKMTIDKGSLKRIADDFLNTLKIRGLSSNKELEKMVGALPNIKLITPDINSVLVSVADEAGVKVYSLDYIVGKVVIPIGIKIEPHSIMYVVRCKDKIEGYVSYQTGLFDNILQAKTVPFPLNLTDISLAKPELERLKGL